MPDGRSSFTQECRTCSFQPVDFSMEDSDSEREASLNVGSNLNRSRDSSKSIESLNTLLMSMPEISIPSPLHNPLPLQCLAANALPVELRREIDGLINEYSAPLSEDHQTLAAQESAITSSPTAPANDTAITDATRATGRVEEVDCSLAEQVSPYYDSTHANYRKSLIAQHNLSKTNLLQS